MKYSPVFDNEVAFAIDLVLQAGKLLLSLPKATEVHFKTNKTPVTPADQLLSSFFAKELRQRFPSHAILNEEEKEDGSRHKKEFCWVVDPLDGTKGYIAGDDNYGPLLGLLQNFQPILGVAYRPVRGEPVYAVQSQGAWRIAQGQQPKRIRVSPSEEIHLLISKTRENEELKAMIKKISPQSVKKQRSSFKIIDVALGKATVFLCPSSNSMHLWDLCAPQIILEEAGGKMTDLKGNHLNYAQQEVAHHHGIIASNEKIHQKVLEILRKKTS